MSLDDRRCALAIAHPGHELRVHGWLERHRPRVYVLTDGSGQSDLSRVHSTIRILDHAGASRGTLFAPYTDRRLYELVLRKEVRPFVEMAETLASDWIRHGIEVVAADAYEGAIMAHDLWRGIVDRAVELAQQATGRVIENVAFSLESNPMPFDRDDPAIHSVHRLGDARWSRKIEAARSYVELRDEVEAAFAAWGVESLRFETLLSAAPSYRPDWTAPPAYERHGERLVAAGVYAQAVRFREHVKPILDGLAAANRAA